MKYPDKEIWKSFLAIIAGTLIAIIVVVPVLYLVGMISFSDARQSHGQIVFNMVLWLCGIAGGSLTGGYFTAKLSPGNPYIHAIFAGMILTFLYLLIGNFDLSSLSLEEKLGVPLFITFTSIGAYLFLQKKKITNTGSFPPDNSQHSS